MNKRDTFLEIASTSQKRLKSRKYLCMYPKCTEYCIKSHSIQKRMELKKISKNGNVYGLNNDTTSYESYFKNEATFRLIGISEASTFNGYCPKHDHELFEPIENGKYDLANRFHNLLLYLRSLSCMYDRKRHTAELLLISADECRKSGIRDKEKRLLRDAKIYFHDAKVMKKWIDSLFMDLKKRKYNNYGFSTFRLEGSFNLSCVTLIDELMLFGCRNIFSNWSSISFSFLPCDKFANVAFVWRKGFDFLMRQFINFTRDNIGLVMNTLLFHFNEDTLFNPDDWSKLNEENKEYLRKSFVHPSFRLDHEVVDILQYFVH